MSRPGSVPFAETPVESLTSCQLPSNNALLPNCIEYAHTNHLWFLHCLINGDTSQVYIANFVTCSPLDESHKTGDEGAGSRLPTPVHSNRALGPG